MPLKMESGSLATSLATSLASSAAPARPVVSSWIWASSMRPLKYPGPPAASRAFQDRIRTREVGARMHRPPVKVVCCSVEGRLLRGPSTPSVHYHYRRLVSGLRPGGRRGTEVTLD